MLANRSSTNRFSIPQTRADWEQLLAHAFALLAKVPLSTWQFIVRFLLVLSLSISLARLFWLLFPTPNIPAAAVAIPTASTQVESTNSAVNIEQLKGLTIFGKAAPKQEQQQPVVEQASVTQLNLVLVGVIVSSDENSARAMIAAGDKQDLYPVGGTLPGGSNVTLSKVMSDRVIINNNGQYESLWLYQTDPNAQPVSRPISSPQPIVPQPQAGWASSAPSVMGPEMHSPDKSSEPAFSEVSRNLSDVVAMTIHRENGQVVGYKIRPGRDAEKFKSLGLQPDDVVTAINGMPLTNPAKIMEVYKNMGNTTSASLEIKRSGSVITVDVVL